MQAVSSLSLSLSRHSILGPQMRSDGAVRVTAEVWSDGVAVITICNPPVLALAPDSASSRGFYVFNLDLQLSGVLVVVVIAGLKEEFTEALNRRDLSLLPDVLKLVVTNFRSPGSVLVFDLTDLDLVGQKAHNVFQACGITKRFGNDAGDILLELLQIFSPVVVTMGTSFSFFLLVKSENRSHLFSFSDAT
ncbi:hypothetical protein C4D60_Mb10t08550 [Musa balbisiana]|uniref:Uncharacterized protein n=1 Tax=Musa balbisiana TaxID=52838 RepID=A0A4S8IVL0_MUSBA|nr:hypothetical protein C4D60_Mb10t08550 [Musa balbisiana]